MTFFKKFKNKEFRNKFFVVAISLFFLLGSFLPYLALLFK